MFKHFQMPLWIGIILAVSFSAGMTFAEPTLTIKPLNPTVNDPIEITVSGEWANSGYDITSHSHIISGNTIQIKATIVQKPDIVYLQVITPWSFTENIGKIPGGQYKIEATINTYSVTQNTYSATKDLIVSPFITRQLTNDTYLDTTPTIAIKSSIDGRYVVAHIAWHKDDEIFYSTYTWDIHDYIRDDVYSTYSFAPVTPYTWGDIPDYNDVLGTPINVSNMPGVDLKPCIAVDNNGHVHIAWWNHRNNYYYANNSSGSFVTQTVAYSRYGHGMSLALDSTNTPHIAWGGYCTNGIHYTSGDFSNEITLPGTGSDDGTPVIGVDSRDNVHIIWERYYTALHYTNNVSGTFADPTYMGGNIVPADTPPNMEFDSGDHIHIAFTKSFDPPQRDVMYGNNVSGSFSFTRMTNTSGSEIHPSVAIDANDKVHLVWQSWTDETLLYTNNLSGSFAPSIQIAANAHWDSSYRGNADRIIGLHSSGLIGTVYTDTSEELWIAWAPVNELMEPVPKDLVLENKTINTTEDYQATNSITAGPSFRIEPSGDVTFRAGNVIRLLPGFTAKSGSKFHASIEEIPVAAPALSPHVEDEAMKETIAQLPHEEATVPITELLPQQPRLLQNYPNPFNPDTWIPYQLSSDAQVNLTIYDMTGRVVRTIEVGSKPAGRYKSKSKAIYWDGHNEFGERVASGVYFYRIEAGNYTAMRKMVILK